MSLKGLLNDIPEKCLLELLYKLPPVGLIRLRQTCKKMDEFFEQHRFKITRFRSHMTKVLIKFQDNEWKCSKGIRNRPPFYDPYKQLSAIPLRMLALKITEQEVSSTNFRTLINLLEKLKLKCLLLYIHEAESHEEVLKIAECISTTYISVLHPKTISIQTICAHPAIQSLRCELRVETNVNGIMMFPESSLLECMKSVALFEFSFPPNQFQQGLRVLQTIIQELPNSTDFGKLHRIKFTWSGGYVDPSILSDKLFRAWLETTNYPPRIVLPNERRSEVFVKELPSRFLLIHCFKSYSLSLFLCKKNAEHLRRLFKGITKETPKKHIIEHIVKVANNLNKG